MAIAKRLKRLDDHNTDKVNASDETARPVSLAKRLSEKNAATRRLESLFNFEEAKARDETRIRTSLPKLFDQIHLYLRSRKSKSMPLLNLSKDLTNRSPDKALTGDQTTEALKLIAKLSPEFCTVQSFGDDESRMLFILKNLPKDTNISTIKKLLIDRIASSDKIENGQSEGEQVNCL